MHDAVSPEELARWHRWFAVDCNNRAWRLAESRTRSAQDDAQMLHCAHAAALHWSKVGGELHNVRAAMLLGHVCALLGDGKAALAYARHAYEYVMSHESPAWEIAFAHAVLANAAAACGDRGLHESHYGKASALGSALPEADRVVFEATFRAVPASVAA